MPNDDQEFTAGGRFDQWRALLDMTRPVHGAGCRSRQTDESGVTPPCDCVAYGLSAGLHSVAELHAPVSKARRVTCSEHARTPIWSELSSGPDICPDCKLVVDLRCSTCETITWPCTTAVLALACTGLSTTQEVEDYREHGAAA